MDLNAQNSREQFQHHLEETLLWCASRDWAANSAEGLRTALLRPSEQASVTKTFLNYEEFWKITDQQRWQMVEQLATKRAALLHYQPVKPLDSSNPLSGGRLLAFDPLSTLSDGGAWSGSQGFFDYDSVPAWDTWIFFDRNCAMPGALRDRFDSYLLCWVPELLVEAVAEGIDRDIGECIIWASDLDTVFIRRLRQAGLLI